MPGSARPLFVGRLVQLQQPEPLRGSWRQADCMAPMSFSAERLERDLALMHEGVRRLFVNDFKAAEEIFNRGAREVAPSVDGSSSRDLRGAFALNWTMVSLLFGLLSFANAQLEECLQRVWLAEKLTLEDPPWVGQRIILGIIYLTAGIAQLIKNAWVKAGINLVRSLRYIREFEDGLAYEGPEQAVVRSVALYFLGLFNYVISMLPPRILSLASRAGGSLQGDRVAALELLQSCRKEGGIFAPYAASVLLAYRTSLKPLLGETTDDTDLAAATELLEWADARYPESAVFGLCRADLFAMQREVPEAILCVHKVHDALAPLQLPAIDFFLEQKKAIFYLATLEWRTAAEGFERSLRVNILNKRRSWVPFISYLAGLCRLLDGDAVSFRVNFGRIAEYAKLRKRNWPPEDDMAFEKAKDLFSEPMTAFRALLDVLEVSMLKLQGLQITTPVAKQQLCALMEDASWSEECPQGPPLAPASSSRVVAEKRAGQHGAAPEEAARALLFRAELTHLLGDADGAKRFALDGLRVASDMGPRGAKNGTEALLHLTLAVLNVDGHLVKLDQCGRSTRAFDDAIRLKALGLASSRVPRSSASRARASSGSSSTCTTITVSADCTGSPGLSPQVTSDLDEEDEFFSADEGDFPVAELPELAEVTGRHDASSPMWVLSDSVGKSLSRATKSATKASKQAAKRLAKAVHAAGAATGAVDLSSSSGPYNSDLLLSALHQQAMQGDCSVVSMPPPDKGASRAEILAYLKWVQWSSLKGMTKVDAMQGYMDLLQGLHDARQRNPGGIGGSDLHGT